MLLEVNDLEVGYPKRTVVHGASIGVDQGEIVALIGHNGGGKTTTLRGIFGLLRPTGGQVQYKGIPITSNSPKANVTRGIAISPQEGFVFPALSVAENLELGGYATCHPADLPARLATVHDLFPILKQRARQRAGSLSGGEQRMLGIGMALMTGPQLLLLDEPSLGLSPLFVGTVMDALEKIRGTTGAAILIVEQSVKQVLRVANRVYVMKMGSIVLEESAERLLRQGQWWDLF